jgi:hypothetical protein
MVLYAYVCVCTFFLHRESPGRILGDNPCFLGGFCHSSHQSKIGVKHIEASKNLNNVVSEERLAHIRIIVVFLGGKLTYVFFYATTEMHQRRYVMIFGVLILFCC